MVFNGGQEYIEWERLLDQAYVKFCSKNIAAIRKVVVVVAAAAAAAAAADFVRK